MYMRFICPMIVLLMLTLGTHPIAGAGQEPAEGHLRLHEAPSVSGFFVQLANGDVQRYVRRPNSDQFQQIKVYRSSEIEELVLAAVEKPKGTHGVQLGYDVDVHLADGCPLVAKEGAVITGVLMSDTSRGVIVNIKMAAASRSLMIPQDCIDFVQQTGTHTHAGRAPEPRAIAPVLDADLPGTLEAWCEEWPRVLWSVDPVLVAQEVGLESEYDRPRIFTQTIRITKGLQQYTPMVQQLKKLLDATDGDRRKAIASWGPPININKASKGAHWRTAPPGIPKSLWSKSFMLRHASESARASLATSHVPNSAQIDNEYTVVFLNGRLGSGVAVQVTAAEYAAVRAATNTSLCLNLHAVDRDGEVVFRAKPQLLQDAAGSGVGLELASRPQVCVLSPAMMMTVCRSGEQGRPGKCCRTLDGREFGSHTLLAFPTIVRTVRMEIPSHLAPKVRTITGNITVATQQEVQEIKKAKVRGLGGGGLGPGGGLGGGGGLGRPGGGAGPGGPR